MDPVIILITGTVLLFWAVRPFKEGNLVMTDLVISAGILAWLGGMLALFMGWTMTPGM